MDKMELTKAESNMNDLVQPAEQVEALALKTVSVARTDEL